MSLQLRASTHQLADLKRIVELGNDQLLQVLEKLGTLEAPVLRPEELLSAVREVLSPNDADPLVRQILSLHGILRQTGRSIDDVMAGVRAAIERQGDEGAISAHAWSGVESILKGLVQLRSVRLAATAIELAYDYANLLRQSKILTDIRPLYTEEGDSIEGAVISYTLRLLYNSADGEHELSIALDESDVTTLIEQCQRAIRKAAAAKTLMSEKCKVAASISGEAIDD